MSEIEEYVRHGTKCQLNFDGFVKSVKSCHSRENGSPKLIEKTGFPLSLELRKRGNRVIQFWGNIFYMIIQIYEIQTPHEAQALIEAGVDHIGSVLNPEGTLKRPLLKETIDVVKSSASKSSLIPLFSDMDAISHALDFYKPDIVHFCEDLNRYKNNRPGLDYLVDLQENIKERFPEILIMRSIPIPQPGIAGFFSSIELAKIFEHVSDFF